MSNALVLCARVGTSDAVLLKPGVKAVKCGGCGVMVWASPTSLALPNVTLMCHPCGKAAVMAQQQQDPRKIEMLIAPGALEDDTDADRRRRSELEAFGFRNARPEDIEEMNRG